MANEGFDPASFQTVPANTPGRPWDAVIEPVQGGPLKAGYTIGRWNHVDGTVYTGYRYPNGQLIGCPGTPSATRATANAAEATAEGQRKADDATFLAEMDTLAAAVKALTNADVHPAVKRLALKLYRAYKGILRDL